MSDPSWGWNDGAQSSPKYGNTGNFATDPSAWQQNRRSSITRSHIQSSDLASQTQHRHLLPSVGPVPENNYYAQHASTQNSQLGYGETSSQSNDYFGSNPQNQGFNYGYGTDQNQYFSGAFSQQLLSDPMVNAAKQFGGQFAEDQKQRLTKYLSGFHLKYYFAVDNSYVGKKLAILLFPFFHRGWAVQCGNGCEPVPARLDVNAPDLYIPLMAFVTYVLISGFVLGIQGRFSPEHLGIITSNALIYLFLENLIILITKYIMNISQALSLWHSLAFSSYKYVGMNVCLLLYLIGGKTVYYTALAYTSSAMVFFLLRTVRTFVLDVQSMFSEDGGKKRKLYLLLFIAFTQPFVMWWLTSSVAKSMPSTMNFAELALSGIGFKDAFNKGRVPLLPDGEVDYEALLKMP